MRSAQKQASNAEAQAGNQASTFGSEAQAANAQLFPYASGIMKEFHGLNPEQFNEDLTLAASGSGGANAALAGQGALQAARTRNSGGYASALDASARNRDQALAKTMQSVGAQDINLANQHHEQGANLMSGLYGADTKAMLGEQDVQNQAIANEIKAGQSGWFQNLTGFMSAINGAGFGKLKL